jgi:aminoglycoside phosphotransferase (APT) family kinase protein
VAGEVPLRLLYKSRVSSETPIATGAGGRWSAEQADEMAGIAAARVGVAGDHRLVRYGTNAIFEFPAAGLALRLTPPGTRVTQVETQVAFARWAQGRGCEIGAPAELPVVREGLEGGVASFWQWLDADAERAGPEQYALALRAFHDAVHDCPLELPRWNPFGRLEDRWTNPEVVAALGDALAGELRARSAELAESPLLWSDVQVIHGDAHAGNLLHCAGVYVWTDFDLIARGPALDDLASYGLAVRRFGRPDHELDVVLGLYGASDEQRDQLRLVTRVKELLSLAWLSTTLARPGALAEFRRRVASVVDDTPLLWQPF